MELETTRREALRGSLFTIDCDVEADRALAKGIFARRSQAAMMITAAVSGLFAAKEVLSDDTSVPLAFGLGAVSAAATYLSVRDSGIAHREEVVFGVIAGTELVMRDPTIGVHPGEFVDVPRHREDVKPAARFL